MNILLNIVSIKKIKHLVTKPTNDIYAASKDFDQTSPYSLHKVTINTPLVIIK